ncbi:MAG: hypothetical protein F6K30_31050 [Cyanothece sp. SIO2G6]|nr:hypothetical protein [Cyanothece sp. SIO2G6]
MAIGEKESRPSILVCWRRAIALSGDIWQERSDCLGKVVGNALPHPWRDRLCHAFSKRPY